MTPMDGMGYFSVAHIPTAQVPPSASSIWRLLGLAAPATDATPRSSAVERNGLSEGFRGVILAMLPFPEDFFAVH